MLRYLAEHYRVTVASMIDDAEDVKYIDELKAMVHQVFYAVRSPLTMKLKAAGSLLSGEPFTVPCFYSKSLQQEIDGYLDGNDVKAILCFCSSSAEYVFRSRHYQKTLRKKLLLADLVDVDSEKWRQYADKHAGPMKWIYRREATKLLPYEQRIIDTFDRTFLVSEEEMEVMAQYGPVDKVEALSNGVDLEYFCPGSASQCPELVSQNKLVFSGAMDYWPNVEGAVWFARNVFPEIRKAVPDVVFCIAGRNPDNAVVALQKNPGIEVTGTVPDMRECLSDAAICVVPLQIARGIQNKVLEGMAMKKTVVATTGAATGLKAISGKEIVVVENKEEMATVIINLLADKDRCQRVGENARHYVEREHSWDAHLGRLSELIDAGKSADD